LPALPRFSAQRFRLATKSLGVHTPDSFGEVPGGHGSVVGEHVPASAGGAGATDRSVLPQTIVIAQA